MSRDPYGFRAEPEPTPAGDAGGGGAAVPFDDPDARRALWLAGAAIGSIALAPCVCYLSLLGTIPLGVMSWRASTPIRARTSPLVRDVGRFAHVTGIVTTVLGSISLLALLAYGLFLGALMFSGDSDADVTGGADQEIDIVAPSDVEPGGNQPAPTEQRYPGYEPGVGEGNGFYLERPETKEAPKDGAPPPAGE